MIKILFFFLSINFIFADTIQVLAAANLSKVLEKIKDDFLLTNPQHKIHISYISSGKAYAQIKNQAPVHLFVSADTFYPQKLFEEKLATKPRIYAKGTLILWSKNIKIKNLETLLDSKIKNIALPNPDLAPYGRAAKQALENTQLYSKIAHKISQASSISQAHQWIDSNNCEIGFDALSLIDIKDSNISFIKVPTTLYEPILQALTLTKFGEQNLLAQKFANFILDSKIIFEQYGYLLP